MNIILKCLFACAAFGVLVMAGMYSARVMPSFASASTIHRSENTADGSSLSLTQEKISLVVKNKEISIKLGDIEKWKRSGNGLNLILKDRTRLYFNFPSLPEAEDFESKFKAELEL